MPAHPNGALDPYRAWLNVREVRRPLTAYQLLRLDALENDMDAIRTAAGLQRTAIQTRRHDAPPAVWKQVHNELEEAIDTLLDPDKKAAYDAALAKQNDAGAPGPPFSAHAAGSDQGGTLRCPDCQGQNPATRKYCVGCGLRLWEPCFRCGSLSFAGDKFCGACGADFAGGVERMIQDYQANLAKVRQLQATGQYDEAIALAEPLTQVANAQLKPYADQAEALIQDLLAESRRRSDEAKASLASAKQRAADGDYEAAARVLADVPASLRSEEAERLLAEAQARLAEIASLEAELSSAKGSRPALRLMPTIGRLLALKPDSVRARQLAVELHDHVRARAREKLASCRYREALTCLKQVPDVLPSGELETLRDRAAELTWLVDDLRGAPVVDKTLVRVAERIAELAPNDAQIAKLLGELRRRVRIAAGDPRRAFPPWAAPPRETPLGLPVDWITGLGRIGVREDLVEPILAGHPGQLWVACGLALEGLGQTSVECNLIRHEPQSLLGRAARMIRQRAPRTAWGLDLGSSSLKAVKLALDAETGGAVIEDFDVVPHRSLLSDAFSEAQVKTLLEETVATFCSRKRPKADRLCLGLPGRMLLVERFTMPPFDRAKMDAVVAFQARRHVPVPLEGVAWDYAVMEQMDGEGRPQSDREVLLMAVKRFQLSERLAPLRQSGLHVDVVESDCLALHSFLRYEQAAGARNGPSSAPNRRGAVALLDVGSDQTNFVVSAPDFAWFRSTGFGGYQFSRALVRQLQLTAAQAETPKRDPAGAPSIVRMYTALEPVFDMLVEEIRWSLDAFARQHRDRPVTRLLGCGGSFQLHGLLRYLRSGF